MNSLHFSLSYTLLTLSFFFASSFHLSAREFTDSKGRKIEARIVSATPDGKIEILRKGKKITVAVNIFSLDDQEYIRTWIKEHPDSISYRFNYYVDLKELREKKSSRNGSMTTDKLISKPQQLLINVNNKNSGSVKNLKIVVDAIVEDAVNIEDGSYSRLAVGGKRNDLLRAQRFRAKADIEEIKFKGRAEITFEFDIERYVDRDNGYVDGTATDKVLGAWIRIYKKDKLVGEFKRSFESKFDKVEWQDKNLSEPRNVKISTK
ncbi:MAG: hypothetical protein QM496_18875 [Verrucomicrobiota bacterium]